jgi:hypothetical protein
VVSMTDHYGRILGFLDRISYIFTVVNLLCGLGHELFSPAPTLRSWVRIPLEAWMFVCVLCAFFLFLQSQVRQPAYLIKG